MELNYKLDKNQKIINLNSNLFLLNNFEDFVKQYIKNNNELESLDVGFCRLKDEKIRLLTMTLKTCDNIKQLVLDNNIIWDVFSDIAILLETTKLSNLSINANCASNKGCSIISNALSKNDSLKILQFRLNDIDDTGIFALADSLRINNTLKKLNLNNNNITDSGAMILLDVLKTNLSLIKLNLGGNYINNTLLNEIETLLKRNRKNDKNVKKLLLLTNSFCDSNFFYKDNLPLDLFKKIYFLIFLKN